MSSPIHSEERAEDSRAATCSVLFARSDSVYKKLGVDVWDAERDALKWPGGNPVIAHPPCRAWGRLRHFAKPAPGEMDLARWSVAQVRRWGGVLEHPATSKLWEDQNLPEPNQRDKWGGWTLQAPQWWWGHRADKPTRFYICGCDPRELPEIPFKLGVSDCVIRLDTRRPDGTYVRKGDPDYKPRLAKAEREATPPELAKWLVELASICRQNSKNP
jgi:hypothetical protein